MQSIIVRNQFVVASPICVVIIGTLAARFFRSLLGNWAWAGSSLVYWGSMLLTIWLLGDKHSFRYWFRKSEGSRWWAVFAIGMGLIAFPLLLIHNLHLIDSNPLVLIWFLFAVINSICEETYWRGFLLDKTRHLHRSSGVIYSTVLFVAIHPLMLGVFSRIQAFDPANPLAFLPFGVILVILALIYCLLYLRTKSLRLAILSHFLSDIGNLSIFLFMNMIPIP